MQRKVFSELITPLTTFCENAGTKIDEKSRSKVLFFEVFLQILVFGYSIQVGSMRKLLKELSTNDIAKSLGLPEVAYSTFRDAFTRFKVKTFSDLYTHVLSSFTGLESPDLENLGLLKAVDGSLFPVLRSMEWAKYKSNFKALKLHLSFNLNTSCPNEFLVTEGNYSERQFLMTILQKGVTYICDRGYFSFDLLEKMNEIGALFVLRLKANLQFTSGVSLSVTGLIPACFTAVEDDLVRFKSDKEQKVYRIVRFRVLKSYFILCTNRLDLSTIQIIMLYAYRWQIELIFKFLKHQLKGLHLFAQTEQAVQINFYILLINALLQIRLKQIILSQNEQNLTPKKQNLVKNSDKNDLILTKNSKQDIGGKSTLTKNSKQEIYTGGNPEKWLNSVNTIFKYGFKISSDWLLYLKNSLHKIIDNQIITLFNTA